MQRTSIQRVTIGAAIAALYVLLTELSALMGLASGVIQFRLSEALCVLSVFTPVAAPALAVGCLLANALAACIPIDIVLGSVATLLGALGGRLLRRLPYLAPLPTVVANVLLVPPVLKYFYAFDGAYPFFCLTVGIGEVVCAWGGGILLYLALKPHKDRLFPA